MRKKLALLIVFALLPLPAFAEDFVPAVEAATDTRFGDYQTNAAMLLAKPLKKNPRELAAAIVEAADVDALCASRPFGQVLVERQPGRRPCRSGSFGRRRWRRTHFDAPDPDLDLRSKGWFLLCPRMRLNTQR